MKLSLNSLISILSYRQIKQAFNLIMHPFTVSIIIFCYVFLFMTLVSSQTQHAISISHNRGGHHLPNQGHHRRAGNANGHAIPTNRPATTIQNQNQNQINPQTRPSNPSLSQNQNRNQNQIYSPTPPSNPNQNQNKTNPFSPTSNPNQYQNQASPRTPASNPYQNQNESQDQENKINPGRIFGWNPNNTYSSDKNILLADEFLHAHNWVRSKYNISALIWDDKLEMYARKYLMQRYNDCLMVHSNGSYGENLFWGKKLHWTPSDAVYFWYMEKDFYDFKTLKCFPPPSNSTQGYTPKSCGHFTQIVWRDSTRLGCALQDCNDRNAGKLIACEYDPPGNYDNENPLEHYS